MPALPPAFSLYADYVSDPHRWIDLRNPYLGFGGRRRNACLEVNDYAPKVGEIGLGLRMEIGEDADEWSCQWKVTKPDGTEHWYQGAIEDTDATLVADDSVFDMEGSYSFQAMLYQSGRVWPQECMKVYCNC